MKKNNLKIALVHDFLVDFGGAERVFEVFCEMFPEAPIYTLLYDKDKMKGRFEKREIHTSFLQKFPRFLRNHKRWLLPFLPVAPETFDLRDFDLVISSSGAWSKGIITRLNTIHIAYIHSPMRFVWDYNSAKYLKENKKSKFGFCVQPFLNYLRIWDKQAADRPDYIIANSKYTQKRIAKYYRRESEVVYPPTQNFQSISNESINTRYQIQDARYFLIVSRLSPYKRVDLAVKVFNKLNLPLVVIGDGEQKEYLQKIAKSNVKILGWKDDDEVARYLQEARAFVFPAVDDFGLTIIEAISVGVPVVAYREGGALEIIKEGENGEFFNEQTAESLTGGVGRFIENEKKYNKEIIKQSVEKFSKEIFVEKLRGIIGNIEGL
jgi:glycosyltransferase involved in cell wall biosynthesis